MRLDIRLFAGLTCANPTLACCGEREFQLEVPLPLTIRELRDLLGINPAVPLLTMINNHHENEDWLLKDNDRVGMFPPIGGG